MNQNQAKVIGVENGYAWVEIPERVAACGSCQNSGNCQTGLLDGGGATRRYRIPNPFDAAVGDTVQLHVADGTLWRASFVSYLMPAMLAIAGAAFGQEAADDLGAMMGVLVGLASGFLFLRRIERRGNFATPILSIRRRPIHNSFRSME